MAGLLLLPPARAQVASLTGAQREKLAALAKNDKEAEALFQRIKRDADGALKATPNPIQKIQSEGKLKNDPAKIRTSASLADMRKISSLAYAYTVTGDTAYAEQARTFLLAWAKMNEPTGDPIDETNLESPIVAFDLVRPTFSEPDRAVVEGWLRKIAAAEIKSRKEKSTTSFNNWNSHRLKIIGLIGFALADKALIEHAVQGYQTQIGANLKPDGSSFDFHERDALHYHVYDLDPLLTLAIAARQNGVDLYNYQAPSGASLPKSVRFLVPYADGSKQHPEWVNSKVAFDRKRAESGDEHYKSGRLFEPKEAVSTLELASYFDPSLLPLTCRLLGRPVSPHASWVLLLNSVKSPK